MTVAFYDVVVAALAGYVLAIVAGAAAGAAIDDWLSKRKRGKQ